jgi:hypothetical protein
MDKIIAQLKALKEIKPRAEWTAKNRALLLTQITAQTFDPTPRLANFWYLVKSLFPLRALNFIARPVGVITILLAVVFGSGVFTVSASKDSLPGDILYGVKLTSEKVQVGMTMADDKKAELHANFAVERTREIDQIVKENSSNKNDKIKIAMNGLKDEMVNVSAQLDKVKMAAIDKSDLNDTIKTVQNVDSTVTRVADSLAGNKDQFGTDKDAVENLSAAVAATEKAGVKAVEVLVTKYDAGGSTLTPEEVMSSVEKQLQQVEDKIKNNIDTTPVINQPDKQGAPIIKAVVPVNEASKALDEARQLLSAGDLASALEKVKEGSAINTETNAIQPTTELKNGAPIIK